MLRDKQRKLELGRRMHKLWEESGHTQQAVADAIGLKHRSYQKALQTGGISYEKLANLAAFHGVELDWLLQGDPEEVETPDPFPVDPTASQLDRIEEGIREILKRLDPPDEAGKALPSPPPLPPTSEPTPEASPSPETRKAS